MALAAFTQRCPQSLVHTVPHSATHRRVRICAYNTPAQTCVAAWSRARTASLSAPAAWPREQKTRPASPAPRVGRTCAQPHPTQRMRLGAHAGTHTHSSTPPTHHRQCRRARQPPIPCLSLYRSTIATSPTPPAQHSHTTVMTRTCWQRPQATHLLQGHRATAVCKGVEQLAHETSKPGRGNPQAVSLGATGGGEGEGDHTHRRTWLARPQARC